MTPADIATMTRVMGPVVREFTANAVQEATVPLLTKIAELEIRLGEADKYAVRIEGYTSFLQRDSAALSERVAVVESRPVAQLDTVTPEPVAGPAGKEGQKGQDGAGIASLVVSAEGRLLAHLTDGRSLDAGPVPKGERGEPGQSVVGPSGERGHDAQVPDVDAIVTRVLALVPPPARGEKGDSGERGSDGASVDTESLFAVVDARITKALAEIPVPTNGRDGQDAQPLDVDAVVARVAALMPAPKDGAPGLDGRSVTLEDLAPLIAREIETRVAALPVAKDGIGFTGAVVTREGHLVLTLSNGTTQDIGTVIGKDGALGLDGKDAVGTPGKDGLDGLGFDDFDLTLDETRGWILRLSQGERVKEWELGIPFDAKVYQAGLVYPKGAGVTWDGNYWICLAQTSDQPGEGCPSWRLAVRRGKQGREGKQGKDGSAGRDLTQMDPATGRKW